MTGTLYVLKHIAVNEDGTDTIEYIKVLSNHNVKDMVKLTDIEDPSFYGFGVLIKDGDELHYHEHLMGRTPTDWWGDEVPELPTC